MSVVDIIQQIVMRTDEHRMDISKDQETYVGHVKVTNCGSAMPPGDCIVIFNCQYVVNFEF